MKKYAFTLAEVLITLGIIGIVAAMTIPTLFQSYKKKMVETKLVKVSSLINQAINAETWEGGEALERIDFDASNSNVEYGRADTVTPENTSILCGLYLGRPSEV